MKTVSCDQMRALDRKASEVYGIPSLTLMENAGKGIADLVGRNFGPSRVVILCGKGNNAGDGFVAARYLSNRGSRVDIFCFADPSGFQGDALENWKKAAAMKIPSLLLTEAGGFEKFLKALEFADVVIDALFGTGLRKALEEPYLSGVHAVNASGKPVIAADIPSGLNGDTGEVLGEAIKADLTATFGFPKNGLYQGRGPEYAGEIVVVDIGFPKEIAP